MIEKITSGFPVFIVTSTNNSGVNFTNNTTNYIRPNQVCSARSDHPTVDQWFNTQCFVDPPKGEVGNANRAPLYGPDFVNTDFSVNKHFPLAVREGMEMEFRAEFFNLFNHPQFYVPVADRAASNFGAITETVNNPRLMQFGLKLRF